MSEVIRRILDKYGNEEVITRPEAVEYIEFIAERLEKKYDLIEALNKRIYDIVLDDNKYYNIVENMFALDRIIDHYVTSLTDFYTRIYVVSSNPRVREHYKGYIAMILTVFYFMNHRAPEFKRFFTQTHNRLIEYFDVVKSEDVVDYNILKQAVSKDMINKIGYYLLNGFSNLYTEKLGDYGRYFIDNLFDYTFGAMNILGAEIVNSILKCYRKGSEAGKHFAVYGKKGTGKTTITFYSFLAALRFIGIEKEFAEKAVSELIINDPLEILGLVTYVSDPDSDFRLPALIADDIASSFSKYWMFAGKEKEAILGFMKLLKIGRERMGVVMFPAPADSALPRGIRESVESVLYGEPKEFRNYMHIPAIFIATTYTPRMKIAGLRAADVTEGARKQSVYELIGVVTPPMYIPNRTYERLEKIKSRIRREHAVMSMESLIRKILGVKEKRAE